jgi:hypothetical protein
MTDEERRQRKNEYQREWRAKKQGKETPPKETIINKPVLEVSLENTDPLKKKPKKAKKVELKESSIATYTSKLRAFHKRMTGLPLSQNMIDAIEGKDYDKNAIKEEFKYLYEKIDYIKEHEINAIPNLCKVFTKFIGFAKLIKILTPVKRNIEDAEVIRRNETTIKEEDMISFDKQEVMANAVKLTDDYEKIMYLLMMLIPTRRLDDYRTMTYNKKEDNKVYKNIDEKLLADVMKRVGNYYDDENMYIKDTNTKNKKSITIKIPNEIIDLLPKSGYILGYDYTASALSVKFSNMMTNIYGKKIGALDLRRMYLTSINNSGASYLERKNIAEAVGHSVEESLKYSMKVQ